MPPSGRTSQYTSGSRPNNSRYTRLRRRKKSDPRSLFLESLENRLLFDGSWQNPFNPRDVTGDGVVVPIDILNSINELNGHVYIDSRGQLPDRALHPDAPFYDASGDGLLTPVADVLPIINAYNGDVTAPTIVVGLTRDTAPGGTTNTDLLTHDARISGTISDTLGAQKLVVIVDNGAEQTVTVQRDGTFQFNPGFLTDGTQDGAHQFKFIATDTRQNTSSPAEFTIQLDTVGPTPPASVQMDPTSDTGASSTDGITNVNTPTITGDAPAGTVIQVLVGDTVVGQTTANSPWSITTAPIEDGARTLRVVSVDDAGNTSEGGSINLTIDTVAPDAPSGIALTAASDTGRSQTDAITKVRTPTITGLAEAGTTVTVLINNESVGSVAGGNWQFTTAELTDGQRSITATAQDLAGNVSDASAALALTIDTVVPSPPTNLGLTAASDTGVSSTDGITKLKDLTFTATASTGDLVRLFIDGEVVGSATASSPVEITAPTLEDGEYSVTATSEDLAGNLSGATAEFITFIDSVGPSAPTTLALSPTSDTATQGDGITSAGRVTIIGQADGDTYVRLAEVDVSALASQSGDFQLTGVALAIGENAFTVEAFDAAGNTASATEFSVTRVDEALAADPVLAWNTALLAAVRRDASTPPQASRFMAMMHVAVFDAISNIEGTPSYLVKLAPPEGASAAAAVTGAAHRVLSYAFPAQKSWFDDQLANSLADVPDGSAETAGVDFGRAIADAVIQLRLQDGWDDFIDYTPQTTLGAWVPTFPMYDVALLPHWANLEPFGLESPDQFRPDGPPAMDSPEYAAALNDVKQLGRATGSTRTPEQMSIARFWADGPGTVTPAGHWNDIAAGIASDRESSMAENARLFALLNIALADAAVTAWNTKFHYQNWRPITAIRQADLDGNPATEADPAWESLLITPSFPDYVSGHSTFSGAAAEILTNVFGDNVSFTSNSPGFVQPGTSNPVQRTFSSFQQAAEEAGRSRIYGGIHFEFANQDGLAAGRSLADFILERFSTSADDQAPRVILNSPHDGQAANDNLTVAGRVLDNLSGVESLQVSTDNGTFVPVTVAADGSFSFATDLATDGSADGAHQFRFRAVDFRGNERTTDELHWTLDTLAPTASIVTTPDTGLLTGIASGTGSALVKLTYQIDDGTVTSIPLPNANGSYSISPDLSKVATGTHTVKVTATDVAGNEHTESTNFGLNARIPFRVIDHTPESGADEIGSTYRPQVFFSRPIDETTLNNNNFYATDSAGIKVPATIVPAQDGSFAWLFFTNPLPGASTITVHVLGATILSDGDGVLLDADSDGLAGGDLTYSFTTVSLSPLPGTSLSGKVVDPGVDLKPMTFDDIRPGPDGVLHTADDVWLLPIAGVKVFILGLENQFVITDASGNFHFDSVPSGNVKLAIDGRTATNAPAGIYFPEMVMDLYLRAGVANTVMGTMGTREEMIANEHRPEAYLPRLQTGILEDVSDTETKVITANELAAPNLTDAQRQFMTLQVEPQSLIGPDGQPVQNGQVGISTVPPELVRDMLPPGLLQHTFDITIQAPAAATFATPLTLTLPNVFNAAPGTKLNFLSFDHTTGRLVLEGTGTVSEDGLSVTTDAGTGITKPGWHGFTPPVTCANSGGPPPTPKSNSATTNENEPVSIFLHDDENHTDVINREFKGPNKKDPPPPPANGCPPRENPEKEDPPTQVTIQIDGQLSSFMKSTGTLPIASKSYTIPAGTADKTFKIDAKKLSEIFGADGFKNLTQDALFGATVKITEEKGPADNRVKTIDTYVVYKWVDVIDATMAKDKKGTTAVFMRTFADGEFERSKSITTNVPNSAPTKFDGSDGKPFQYGSPPPGNGVTRWFFKPAESDAGVNPVTDNVKIQVTVPFKGGSKVVDVGTLQVQGRAVKKTTVSIDATGYKAELKKVIYSLKSDARGVYYTHKDGQKRYVSAKFAEEEQFGKFLPDKRQAGPDLILGNADDTFAADLEAKLTTETNALFDAVKDDYTDLSKGIVVQLENAGADVQMGWKDLGSGLFGAAFFDAKLDEMSPLICTPAKCAIEISPAAQQWMLAEGLNREVASLPDASVDGNFFAVGVNVNWNSDASFAQYVANTISHEIGHTFGLKDAYAGRGLSGGTAQCGRAPQTGGNCKPNDIMRGGSSADRDLKFSTLNVDLLKAGMGLSANGATPLTDALALYRDVIKLPRGVDGIRDSIEEGNPDYLPLPDLNVFQDGRQLLNSFTSSVGSIAADGVGGQKVSAVYTLANDGFEPLIISSISLAKGNAGFVLEAPQGTQTVAPGESIDITVHFDPTAAGAASDDLIVHSNASIDPEFTVHLVGDGMIAGPAAMVTLGSPITDSDGSSVPAGIATNNLGGTHPGQVVRNETFATINNAGSEPLTISSITAEDASGFTLTGLPGDFDTQPITLNGGETFTFGVQFDPNRVGLHFSEIRISTDDPRTPVAILGVVGTGLPEVLYPQWGSDFVAMETADGTTPPLRVTSDTGGNFQLVIQPDQHYHIAIFDPVTGLIAHGYGNTPAAGGSLDITADLVFEASTEPDSDNDGLPDDVEFAIGTGQSKSDTDGDGISDGIELAQGWDPLDSRPLPLGTIAALPVRGEANEIVLEGSFVDPAGQLAYMATGSFGLAIVDTTKFFRPISLSQLDLLGNATDVAIDPRLQLAAVATNDGGLQVVNIANPRAPRLVRTIAANTGQVEILDGVAYVSHGTKVQWDPLESTCRHASLSIL